MKIKIAINILKALLLIIICLLMRAHMIKKNNDSHLSTIPHFNTHDSIWRKTVALYQENLIMEDSIEGIISLEMNFLRPTPYFEVISNSGSLKFTPDDNSPKTIYSDNLGSIKYYSGKVEPILGNNRFFIKIQVRAQYTKSGNFKSFTDESTEAFGSALRENDFYLNTELNKRREIF